MCGVKNILEIIRCKSDPVFHSKFSMASHHIYGEITTRYFFHQAWSSWRLGSPIWPSSNYVTPPFISCLSPYSFSNAPWTDAPCPTSNACLLTKCVPFIWLGLCSHVSPWSPCLKEQPSSFPCHLNPYVTLSFLQSIHHSWHHTINPLFV